jgi:hypothetical protein
MKPGGIICLIVLCSIITSGCIQLPGMHVLPTTPDTIVGQWIGGEPPASDRHMIFYENGTFYSTNFFLNRGVTSETGIWTKIDRGLYVTTSATGEMTEWVYDSSDDSLSMRRIPQMTYYRYKG